MTYLSPYISRGVISTQQVYKHLVSLDLPWYDIEKLVQELAWRDFWQQIWLNKGDDIFTDLKNQQSPVTNHAISTAVTEAQTGITAVDQAIRELYDTGYMHNHMRMYVASICCNMANSHWLEPAKWMYYHLLDGDLASNSLSWQWVAGAFSNKKYFANQENINKFFNTQQNNTFLDVEYSAFDNLGEIAALRDTEPFAFTSNLPEVAAPILEIDKTTLVYNYYNLDPDWHSNEDFQRVLLLEPSHFKRFPVSENCFDFVLRLSENIPGMKIFIGEFAELSQQVRPEQIIFKEHPTNRHYAGTREERSWLSSVTGYYPSFFKFWNKAKKELRV